MIINSGADLWAVLCQSWVDGTLIARTPRLESTCSNIILKKLVIYDLCIFPLAFQHPNYSWILLDEENRKLRKSQATYIHNGGYQLLDVFCTGNERLDIVCNGVSIYWRYRESICSTHLNQSPKMCAGTEFSLQDLCTYQS